VRDETQSAFDFALVLTAGAHEGGVLEVRRFILSRDHRKHWEARRYTLSQQIEASGGVGVWGHILQQSGRRWVWTTAQGRAQLNTLERWTPRFPIEVLRGRDRRELQAEVLRSVTEGMREADPDLRSRRVSVRGFDPEEITLPWQYEDFRDGISKELPEGEVLGYVQWLSENTPDWIERAMGGVPVTPEVFRLVSDLASDAIDALNLMEVHET
jgi:hypothetical protein